MVFLSSESSETLLPATSPHRLNGDIVSAPLQHLFLTATGPSVQRPFSRTKSEKSVVSASFLTDRPSFIKVRR